MYRKTIENWREIEGIERDRRRRDLAYTISPNLSIRYKQ